MKTRNSTTAEGPRDALCQLKFCRLLRNCTKSPFESACSRWMNWRSLKLIGIVAIRHSVSLLLLPCRVKYVQNAKGRWKQCSNYGGGASGGLAPLVQALPQTPIIGLRSALAIRPPWKRSDDSTTGWKYWQSLYKKSFLSSCCLKYYPDIRNPWNI